jgi:hypothetical protein
MVLAFTFASTKKDFVLMNTYPCACTTSSINLARTGAKADCTSLLPHHCPVVAFSSPRPPFCPPLSSLQSPLPPNKDGVGNDNCHQHCGLLSLSVLLPPLRLFFPPQNTLPPSGRIRCCGRSGGTTALATGCDGPNGPGNNKDSQLFSVGGSKGNGGGDRGRGVQWMHWRQPPMLPG